MTKREVIPAVEYNNPGDVSLPIKGYTGPGRQVGIPGQIGYASFPTMQDGFTAMQFRIKEYISVQGRTTIRKIGQVYAQDPNWPRDVASIAKLPLGGVLNVNNSAQIADLCSAIIKQETGKTLAELEQERKEIYGD